MTSELSTSIPNCGDLIDIYEESNGKINLNSTEKYFTIANCMYKSGRFEEAEMLLVSGLALNSNHTDSHWLLARIESKRDNPKNALIHYNNAIENSKDPKLFASRGLIYERLDNLELALADFNESIFLDPNLAYSYNNRGLVHVKMQNFVLAQKDFDKSKELDSNNPYLYKNIGLLYIHLNQISSACQNFTKSISLGYETFGNEYDKLEVDSLITKYCK